MFRNESDEIGYSAASPELSFSRAHTRENRRPRQKVIVVQCRHACLLTPCLQQHWGRVADAAEKRLKWDRVRAPRRRRGGPRGDGASPRLSSPVLDLGAPHWLPPAEGRGQYVGPLLLSPPHPLSPRAPFPASPNARESSSFRKQKPSHLTFPALHVLPTDFRAAHAASLSGRSEAAPGGGATCFRERPGRRRGPGMPRFPGGHSSRPRLSESRRRPFSRLLTPELPPIVGSVPTPQPHSTSRKNDNDLANAPGHHCSVACSGSKTVGADPGNCCT